MINKENLKKIKKIPSWYDVWTGPFWYDNYGYVYDADNTMVFTIDDLREDNDKLMNEFCSNIVNALNGTECKRYSNLEIKDGCDLYMNGNMIGYFRGWGHLTGTGALNLKPGMAAAIQDELIMFVMNKISQ